MKIALIGWACFFLGGGGLNASSSILIMANRLRWYWSIDNWKCWKKARTIEQIKSFSLWLQLFHQPPQSVISVDDLDQNDSWHVPIIPDWPFAGYCICFSQKHMLPYQHIQSYCDTIARWQISTEWLAGRTSGGGVTEAAAAAAAATAAATTAGANTGPSWWSVHYVWKRESCRWSVWWAQ